MYGIIGILYFY